MKNSCKVWNMTSNSEYSIPCETPEDVIIYFRDIYDKVEVLQVHHDSVSNKNYFYFRMRDLYTIPDIMQIVFY